MFSVMPSFLHRVLWSRSTQSGPYIFPVTGGREHDRVERVLAVFLDQQVRRFFGQKDLPDAVGGLGWADPHLALEPPCRLGDGQRLGLHI